MFFSFYKQWLTSVLHLTFPAARSHTQTHCHHTRCPQAPSLKGSELSALPVSSSLFKDFQAATLPHTHSEQFLELYLFIFRLHRLSLRDKDHLSRGGGKGWLGRTSKSQAQARSVPDWESRKEDIYHHNTHQLYHHAPHLFHFSTFPRLLFLIILFGLVSF